jgi:hypothetical protein
VLERNLYAPYTVTARLAPSLELQFADVIDSDGLAWSVLEERGGCPQSTVVEHAWSLDPTNDEGTASSWLVAQGVVTPASPKGDSSALRSNVFRPHVRINGASTAIASNRSIGLTLTGGERVLGCDRGPNVVQPFASSGTDDCPPMFG